MNANDRILMKKIHNINFILNFIIQILKYNVPIFVDFYYSEPKSKKTHQIIPLQCAYLQVRLMNHNIVMAY